MHVFLTRKKGKIPCWLWRFINCRSLVLTWRTVWQVRYGCVSSHFHHTLSITLCSKIIGGIRGLLGVGDAPKKVTKGSSTLAVWPISIQAKTSSKMLQKIWEWGFLKIYEQQIIHWFCWWYNMTMRAMTMIMTLNEQDGNRRIQSCLLSYQSPEITNATRSMWCWEPSEYFCCCL